MAGIDFYQRNNLDGSVVIQAPRAINIVKSVTEVLNKNGAIVVDEGNITAARASQIVSEATGDKSLYYYIKSEDDKVWNILKEAVNTDRIRVVAIIHGNLPKSFPENVIYVSVGSSMHGKVPAYAVADVISCVTNRGKFPKKVTGEVYFAFQKLCYEALYSPEYRTYKSNVSDMVPRSIAFNFLYNVPSNLNTNTMTTAINRFLEDIHG